MDVLIQVLAIAGIGLGVVSFMRPQKVFRYGFYAAVLAATVLRMARTLGKGEPVGSMDLLLTGFLVTAILGDLINRRRTGR